MVYHREESFPQFPGKESLQIESVNWTKHTVDLEALGLLISIQKDLVSLDKCSATLPGVKGTAVYKWKLLFL